MDTIRTLTKNHEVLKDHYMDRGRTLLSYAVNKDKPEIAAYLIEEDFQPQRTLFDIVNQISALDLEKTREEIARGIGGKTLMIYNANQQRKILHKHLQDTPTSPPPGIKPGSNNSRSI
jgi:hypothetical protein